MTCAEARDELAHRWNAASLMAAAVAEGVHVRNWQPPLTPPARQLLKALEEGAGKRCAGWREPGNNNGGKAA